MKPRTQGYLVLEDGTEFPGLLAGAELRSPNVDSGFGEVVFNTGMTGYQEILTDPSYHGQMVVMTQAHVGNTGINPEDVESERVWPAGFIVQDLAPTPSSWRSTGTLEDHLQKNQVPILTEVDTRALTRHLRSQGVVRGIMVHEADRPSASRWMSALPRFESRDLISEVSTKSVYTVESSGPARFRVAALDFGIKRNQLRHLSQLGCEIRVFPAHASASDLLAYAPHGLFLSNGPGDPMLATYAQSTVRTLLGKLPIFGVCMGHQILSLALGAKTYKLKFGHRGANQPVKNLSNQRVEISSHNHGYAVDERTLPSGVKTLYTNLNDGCCEGITAPNLKAFSVQFHPEAFPGPNDSAILFEQFIDLMKTGNVPQVS